jgi:hypothetical protein
LKKNFFIILSFCILCYACSNNDQQAKKPADVIDKAKMQKVLIDFLSVEAYLGAHAMTVDSAHKVSEAFYAQIFKNYNITRQQFFKSMNWYGSHPAEFEATLQPMIDSLSAMEARTH